MSFLLAAYAALWLGVFAYLLRLAARMRDLREEARQLAAAATSASRRPGPAVTPRHPLEPTQPGASPLGPGAPEAEAR